MTITKTTIGVGFIGAGDIAILHAAAVKKCPGAILVGLWNRSQDRAKQRAADFGCKNYATPEELVKDPAIHAVFVLTNLESHLEYTKLALAAGKHVLVEKPVGVSVAEIEQMRDLANGKKLVCMPGHNYVYEQGMTRTRELVENGDLGKIVSATSCTTSTTPKRSRPAIPALLGKSSRTTRTSSSISSASRSNSAR